MRTRMEVANSDFIKRLAACAARKVVEPSVIVAENREIADQAKQRAIAYYMLGFHRDEIESVLEDSGFPEVDIEAAMGNLEKYAEETAKDGPFSTLQPGQLVKLNKAGTSGVLVDKRPDFIAVQIDDMTVRVGNADIDFQNTAALTQAFQLRKEAAASLQRIADLDYAPEDLGKDTSIRVVPDPEETGGKGSNWPAGVPQEDPRTQQTLMVEDLPYVQEELGRALGVAIREMMDLAREIEQENKVITTETRELEESLKEVRQAKAEHEAKLDQLGNEFLNTVEQMQSVSSEEYTYVMNFLNRLVILHQRVVEPKQNTDLKLLSEYKDFYTGMIAWAESQPTAIKNKVLAGMEEVKEQSIRQMRPVWKRVLQVIWPTKEHRRMSQEQAGLSKVWDSLVAFVQNSFRAVQEYFNSWENEIKPEFEQQTAQVDQFIAQDEALEQAAQAQTAVAAVLKRYK